MGSEAADEFQISLRGSARDIGALPFGELHRDMPDAARGGVDENFLPGLKVGDFEQCLIGSQSS